MRSISPFLAAFAATLALLLAGCGSQTKTVSVASTPPGQSTTASTPTAPAKTSSTPTPAPSGGTTSTRTAPGPAFAEQQTGAGGATAASALVTSKGYTPNDQAEYHTNQTLRVLVGTRTGSGDGYGQQAFFFLGGRYLGTDTKEPSAKLRVVSQGDTEVAIAYPLYRHADPLCCPGGGTRTVHFALNNGKLSALDTIPPANSATGLARN